MSARERYRAWQARHPHRAAEIARRTKLRLRYGLTGLDIAWLLGWQWHACALCGRALGSDMEVDHDHDMGCVRAAVRGLVHHRCNGLIGVVERGKWTGQWGFSYDELVLAGEYLARPYPLL